MKTSSMRIIATALALLLALTGVALAQNGTTATDFKKAGGAGAQFLKIGVGTRAMGMGGAFAAVATDLSALYWNPSGIAQLDGINFSVQHTAWFADMSHEFVAASFPVGDRIRLGVSTTYFDAGDIEITTIDAPEGTGANYSVSDIAVGVTFAMDMSDEFSVGITGKYVEDDIYDLSASGLAFDAGTMYNTGWRKMKIGMAITNFSGDFSFDGQSLIVKYPDPVNPNNRPLEAQLLNESYPLPLTFRAGLSIDALDGVEGQSLTVAGDFVHLTDNPEKFNLGAEYVWNDLLALRGGYIFGSDEFGVNVGGGVMINSGSFQGSVDYAWADLGKLGNGHRFGISMKF